MSTDPNLYGSQEEKSGLQSQGSIFHHPKLIQADYISNILVLSALNGHEDVFKLFIHLGFTIDRELYKDASNMLLKALSRFPAIHAKFKALLTCQMPELLTPKDLSHSFSSQRLWICFAYLLISTLLIYFLYVSLQQEPLSNNHNQPFSPGR